MKATANEFAVMSIATSDAVVLWVVDSSAPNLSSRLSSSTILTHSRSVEHPECMKQYSPHFSDASSGPTSLYTSFGDFSPLPAVISHTKQNVQNNNHITAHAIMVGMANLTGGVGVNKLCAPVDHLTTASDGLCTRCVATNPQWCT